MRTTDRRVKVAGAGAVASLAVAGLLGGCAQTSAKLSAHDAVENLKKAKAASFTLHIADPDGELQKSSTSASDKRDAQIVADSSLVVTVDPEGDQTLGQAGTATSAPSASTDPAKSLAHSGTFAMVWKHGGKDVATLRSIEGVLYAKLDPAAYQEATGTALPLDAESAAMFSSVVEGIKAGKWLRLDLTSVYSKLQAAGLNKSSPLGTTQPDPAVARRLASELLGAASVATTVSKDGGTTKVDWSADVRKTLDAWLEILQKPEYAKLFGAASSSITAQKSTIDQLPGTPVTGTLTVKDKHLTQATLDLSSVVALSKDPESIAHVKTSKLVVDIDDSPAAVTAPSADDVVQLDQLVDLALGGLKQFGSAAAPSSGAVTD
ncbi:hypothetical protein EV189_0142 [Motilibacter rhizosphaerae]|uniref:Lipoprotein n=1 Tax=Motilibacter rhizosphaerae TaxID=598652 RepID=A0A4Q7NWY4_9ACTN|nr:hypothetical protein [Motilibacter rhizosphaerae]RZS90912.1 hypothetical protein EV189_0142 [Motilibacter rhizosphaerae]